MNKQTLYTELSIQIAVLEAKIDKVLDLLMKPEPYQDEVVIECTPTYGTNPSPLVRRWSGNDNITYCSGNAGGSEDEQFLENYK